jgi:hypothetical protein
MAESESNPNQKQKLGMHQSQLTGFQSDWVLSPTGIQSPVLNWHWRIPNKNNNY